MARAKPTAQAAEMGSVHRWPVSNNPYLKRTPERLVVEGYRHWLAGYQTGMVDSWELVWGLYEELVGETGANSLIGPLGHWVRQTHRCSECPLMRFPYGSSKLCRDECFAAAMISACQHDEEDLRDLCISGMGICPFSSEVGKAARQFADILDGMGHRLLPVPRHVVEEVFNGNTKAGLPGCPGH